MGESSVSLLASVFLTHGVDSIFLASLWAGHALQHGQNQRLCPNTAIFLAGDEANSRRIGQFTHSALGLLISMDARCLVENAGVGRVMAPLLETRVE